MTIRMIQVGLGEWGRDWAVNVLPVAEGVEVAAAVDIDPAAIEKARAVGVLEGVDVYDTVATALRKSDAEAVLVTAAIAAHGPIVLAALEAGRHVLVEKPFTPTLREAHDAVALAEARGLTLAVGQNYRYDPAAVLASRLVRERALGEVHGLTVNFRRLHQFDDSKSPHPELDHSILVQIAIHHFDLMRAILGRDPVRVYCHTWRPPASESRAPQAAAAVIEFDGGAVASYRGSTVSHGDETPWCGVWQVECTDGDIILRGPHPDERDAVTDERRDPVYVELRPRGEAPRTMDLPEVLSDNRVGVLDAFVRAVEGGVALPISGRDNLPSLALMLAAADSARRGEAVPVSLD
jgi:predicted dehydrogenase